MAVGRIVNKDHILQLSVDYSQILQEVALLESAVLPVQSMRDPLLLRVQVVQNDIRIGGAAGREDDYLCKLR
jgi:hypothetical protein